MDKIARNSLVERSGTSSTPQAKDTLPRPNSTIKGDSAGIKINDLLEGSFAGRVNPFTPSPYRKGAEEGGENPAGLSAIGNAMRKINKLHRPSCWYEKVKTTNYMKNNRTSPLHMCELLLQNNCLMLPLSRFIVSLVVAFYGLTRIDFQRLLDDDDPPMMPSSPSLPPPLPRLNHSSTW